MILNTLTFAIIEIFSPVIESYILIVISSVYLKRRFKYKYSLIGFITVYSLVSHVIFLGHSKNIYQLIIFVFITVMLLHIYFIGNIFKKITCFIFFSFVSFIGDALTLLILLVFTDISISTTFTSNYYYAWSIIITKIIQLLLLRIMLVKVFNKKLSIKKEYKLDIVLLVSIYLIIIFMVVDLFFYDYINNEIITYAAIMIALILFAIPSIIMFIFLKIVKKTEEEIEQQQLLKQYKIEYKYSKELNKILDNLRIIKHDLKNHISCMWGLVETDNIEDFKIYLSNLTDELEGLNEGEIIYNVKNNESNK